MTFNATKIATGTSLVGAGALAGVLLAPKAAESERAANTLPAPATVVRTIHIKRVHHRVIHEKPKHVRHAAQAAAPAAASTPVAAVSAAPPPVQPVVAAPAPAPTHQPLRTRTSGSGGSGGGESEHEGGEHGGGDD
jgi:hypothetical protein